jgi:hypothetical protein
MSKIECFEQAEALAKKLMETIGMSFQEHPPVYTGQVNIAVACGAIGSVAAYLLSAVTDESFTEWVFAVANERKLTRAKKLTEH